MNDAPVRQRVAGRFVSDRLKDVPETAREPAREAVGAPNAFGRSRKRRGNVDQFHVDPQIVPAGWTYEYKRASVYNQPDTAHQMALMENGWTPVPAERHAGLFMPPGHSGSIERGGLLLMERPTALCEEARAEDRANAEFLLQAQKEQLGLAMPEAFSTNHPGVRPQVRTSYERGLPQARQPLAID